MKLLVIVLSTVLATAAAVSECYTGDGRYYQGTVSETKNGKPCQRWDFSGDSTKGHVVDGQYRKAKVDANYPDGSRTAAGNNCRNPDGWSQPWCYTTDLSTRWEDCSIPKCLECYTGDGSDYQGTVSKTEDDIPCQRWDFSGDSTSTNGHWVDGQYRKAKVDANYPDGSRTAAGNNCRNPDGWSQPWCYTTKQEVRWQNCKIPKCPGPASPCPDLVENCADLIGPHDQTEVCTVKLYEDENQLTKNCRETCNFGCPEDEEKPETKICEDRARSCKSLVDSGYCSHESIIFWSKIMCKKSCGFCS